MNLHDITPPYDLSRIRPGGWYSVRITELRSERIEERLHIFGSGIVNRYFSDERGRYIDNPAGPIPLIDYRIGYGRDDYDYIRHALDQAGSYPVDIGGDTLLAHMRHQQGAR